MCFKKTLQYSTFPVQTHFFSKYLELIYITECEYVYYPVSTGVCGGQKRVQFLGNGVRMFMSLHVGAILLMKGIAEVRQKGI